MRFFSTSLAALLAVSLAGNSLACSGVNGGCASNGECCPISSTGAGGTASFVPTCCAGMTSAATSGVCLPTIIVSYYAVLGLSCLNGGSGIIGDPIFSGFDGSSFAFSGTPYTYFNILSEVNHQINAFFTPAVLFDHNGTYITTFGFQYDIHRLTVNVDDDGKLKVQLDGKPLELRENENSKTLTLANPDREELGNMTVTFDLFRPYFGNIVEIETPMLRFAIWSVAPGSLDEGGVAQPAYLDSKVSLLAPPQNNAMKGVLGETYNNLVKHLVKDHPIDKGMSVLHASHKDASKTNSLFDREFPDNLFQREGGRTSRAMLEDLPAGYKTSGQPVPFPVSGSYSALKD